MSAPRSHLALAWLIAGALLFQALWAGVPGGARLCIGCPGQGWSISQADIPDAECCDHEGEEKDDHADAVACGQGHCGCIRIPVGPREGFTLTAPRTPSLTGEGAVEAPPVVGFMPLAVAPNPSWVGFATGPPEPPRLLTPMSRRTVLLL